VKKIIYSIVACSVLAATAALAGGPDLIPAAPAAPAPSVIPFLDLQAGAAWRSNKNAEFAPLRNGVSSVIDPIFGTTTYNSSFPAFSRKENHFAGRVAAGLQFPMTPEFKVTTEIGFGGYSNDRYRQLGVVTGTFAPVEGTPVALPTLTSLTNIKVTTSGFDAFVGGMYTVFNNFDLFAKVGGMVENYRVNFDNALVVTSPVAPVTTLFASSISDRNTRSQAVPAVMVGAQYDFNQWVGVHVAYLHTFGDSLRALSLRSDPFPVVNNGVTGPQTLVLDRRLGAPSINAVFGGLQFRLPA
jgi:hypothetical protein